MAFDQIELLENPYHAKDSILELRRRPWLKEDILVRYLIALIYHKEGR